MSVVSLLDDFVLGEVFVGLNRLGLDTNLLFGGLALETRGRAMIGSTILRLREIDKAFGLDCETESAFGGNGAAPCELVGELVRLLVAPLLVHVPLCRW